MPWFKVDDGLASKLETTRIPRAHRAAAIGLWALAGSWSARELTDGFIPEHMVDELSGTPESAAWLVKAGYWSEADGGFQFVTWNGEQPLREKVLEQRRKNTEKVQNWRARNSKSSDQVGTEVGNPVTNHEHNEVVDPAPEPDPSRPSSKEESSSPSARDIEKEFDRAWVNWPKKVEKKRSLAAFMKAAKTRDPQELVADIIRHGNAYAAARDKEYVPALCAWLAGERWTDELPTASQSRGGARQQRALDVIARMAALDAAESGEFPPGHVPSDVEWRALKATVTDKPAAKPIAELPARPAETFVFCDKHEHPDRYLILDGACAECERLEQTRHKTHEAA